MTDFEALFTPALALETVKSELASDSTLIHRKAANGMTLLGYACYTRNWPVAEYLLNQGADPNIKDNVRTPFTNTVTS